MKRFTLDGSPALESRLDSLVERVGDRVVEIAGSNLASLLLVGGYGRGEGGVDRTGGGEEPHNNLDFLLVSRRLRRADREALAARIRAELESMASEVGLGLDLGILSEATLRRSPNRVFFYDMAKGHRLVRGTSPAALRRFSVDTVPASDVWALLVNRVGLLVFNSVLLRDAPASERRDRALRKHAAKAILGAGDAALFARRRYHWSYAEKGRRMARSTDIAEPIRVCYEEALAFRLSPDYGGARLDPGSDVDAWNEVLLGALAPAHLASEASRLKAPDLTWGTYPRAVLSSGDREGPRTWLRRIGARGSWGAREWSPAMRASWRLRTPYERLAIAFPFVAYPEARRAAPEVASTLLGAGDLAAQRRRYLERWAATADPSFPAAARRLGLQWGAA